MYEWSWFERTISLPIYQVSIVLYNSNEFDSIENGRARVLARSDVINQTTYALGISPSILRKYEILFHNPLDEFKVDLILIPDLPTDVSADYGLVTFRYFDLSDFKEFQAIRCKKLILYIEIYLYHDFKNLLGWLFF